MVTKKYSPLRKNAEKGSKYGHFWSHFCNTDDGSIFSKSGHSQSASLLAHEPVEIGQEMLKEHLNMILMPNVINMAIITARGMSVDIIMVKVMNAVTIMALMLRYSENYNIVPIICYNKASDRPESIYLSGRRPPLR